MKDVEGPAIQVENVSKVYRLWNSPGSRLRYSVLSQLLRALREILPSESPSLSALRARRQLQGGEFHALREVSLTVERGESVGIIGRNGSGKSTLLQIIAGTLTPTSGTVAVRGRVAALLELGSGFNGEFTGRENVFLNAALLGLSRAETEARFDRIAAFADIGAFLDQPVKTYSSGMVVRLAFAVQTAVDPDILIVDEALAVGDIYFQNKCFQLLRARQNAGMTLLFVSHDTSSVRSLCRRGLVLREGRRIFFGPSDEAVNAYVRASEDRAQCVEAGGLVTDSTGVGDSHAELLDSGWIVPRTLSSHQDQIGDGTAEILGAECFDSRGRAARSFRQGDTIRFGFRFAARRALDDGMAGFSVRDRYNNIITAISTLHHGDELFRLEPGAERLLYLELPARLAPGDYLLDFGVGGGRGRAGQALHHYHRVGGILAFSVAEPPEAQAAFLGLCDVGARFSWERPVGLSEV